MAHANGRNCRLSFLSSDGEGEVVETGPERTGSNRRSKSPGFFSRTGSRVIFFAEHFASALGGSIDGMLADRRCCNEKRRRAHLRRYYLTISPRHLP
jgi:hypothetical protein